MTPKPSIYVETSIFSYATARPSREILQLGKQMLSKDLFEKATKRYVLYISDLVIDELSQGDTNAARSRLDLASQFTSLHITDDVSSIVEALMKEKRFPAKAIEDAFHVAIAAANSIDYLLSWNCKHIVNPATMRLVQQSIERMGFKSPILCTPYEIMGETTDEIS